VNERESTTVSRSTTPDNILNLSIELRRRRVSTYLRFECDPIDQPSAMDAVERRSWCSLRIRVGQRYASTIWDKSLQSERRSLYLPAFPIVEWLVLNWWPLLNEVCLWETVPRPVTGAAQLKWTKRHCLRSADSSLMLPALYLFHDGRSLRAEWEADSPDSIPNMPGEFLDKGAEQLDFNATQESLAEFVNHVLDRVQEIKDERVHQLAELWRAIQSADTEEQKFCTLAGRMGIDPYDRCELTDEVTSFFEQTFACPDDPLVRDLTEVARPDSIIAQWSWLTGIKDDLQLRPNSMRLPFELPSCRLAPPQFGYKLARQVRALAHIDASAPLDTLEDIAGTVLGKPFRVEDRNHIPGHGIRAIVGQVPGGDIVTAGPGVQRPDNRRFLIARSVYHAIVTSRESQRLVTDAYSWDQKASRAFAAELLAPQHALTSRVASSPVDHQTVEELSREFQTSTFVVEKQLENAGIGLLYE
jgi:hypothetical protein